MKSRYLKPVFKHGHHFIIQIMQFDDPNQAVLYCHTKASKQDHCAGSNHVVSVAYQNIPRGWDTDSSPQRQRSHSGGSVSVPLVRI